MFHSAGFFSLRGSLREKVCGYFLAGVRGFARRIPTSPTSMCSTFLDARGSSSPKEAQKIKIKKRKNFGLRSAALAEHGAEERNRGRAVT